MTASSPESRLAHFPVAFFAMVMGLSGLAIAWHNAEVGFDLPWHISAGLLLVAATAFVVLLLLFTTKLLRHPAAVRQELAHPVQLNFFPTISISLILLGIATLPYWPMAAKILWLLGASLHLIFTLYVLGVWIHQDQFEIHHINPAWFIPVVGNVLVPIAGVPLGFAEPSWLFFSVGILFWLVLFTIIFYRILFHHPLPERLMPTFFILIAPPAVGFIAYTQLTGNLDPFARLLYYSGLFLTLLLATQVGRFARLPFFLSWWAYSFPLAAITIATLTMYDQTGATGFILLSWLLLAVVSVVVAYLFVRTAVAVFHRQVCVPAV
ncbi:tellurite resistance protein-like permease [Thioflavicoccus mobilis 8321]|uniref:Tellurite resistance protein-like permease n=1 Tax=Thioflavicoccus mobilis 8321 TaxID=765912 RepID=L0H126_9GAMM|nr:SLAC1 anion channel family protein [Thioflavicoccus mobilis]AGA91335.1 tellurite resistance protein-like permease [Thioflavicoccus mobilis 8321]